MMRLSPDAARILRRAWSIRFILLAGVFSAAEVALPLLDGLIPVGPGVFAALSGIATGGAFVSRLVAQSNLSGDDA